MLLRSKPGRRGDPAGTLPGESAPARPDASCTDLLDHLLGLDAEKVREQTNVRYLRDAGEAVDQVKRGEADVRFLPTLSPWSNYGKWRLPGQ